MKDLILSLTVTPTFVALIFATRSGRQQAELQLRWDVRDFESVEVDRIEFEGTYIGVFLFLFFSFSTPKRSLS